MQQCGTWHPSVGSSRLCGVCPRRCQRDLRSGFQSHCARRKRTSWRRLTIPEAARSLRVTNARIRNEQDSHRRQAVSDRLSFCRNETETPYPLSHRGFVNFWCLCVFVVAAGAGEWICVYLRDLRFLQAGDRLCVLCASVVLRRWPEAQAIGGGRMDPELSNLTARLPVVQDMQAGADLMTCSTNTASGM